MSLPRSLGSKIIYAYVHSNTHHQSPSIQGEKSTQGEIPLQISAPVDTIRQGIIFSWQSLSQTSFPSGFCWLSYPTVTNHMHNARDPRICFHLAFLLVFFRSVEGEPIAWLHTLEVLAIEQLQECTLRFHCDHPKIPSLISV